eukprot:g7775.t1
MLPHPAAWFHPQHKQHVCLANCRDHFVCESLRRVCVSQRAPQQACENVLLVSTAGADHQLRQVPARILEGRAARFFSSSAGAAPTGPPAPPSRVPPTSDSDPEDEGCEDHPDPPTPLEKIARPTFTQKRVYALQCAVPMIGFGVMDNLIMIQAGDLIDCTLGATFGFATITAAAMGQICSDTSGVCFGGFVDAAFNKLGLPVSDLTPDQLALDSVRLVRTLAMALGVLSGCLLGMTSLLFMDLDKKERLKRQRALATIFSTLAEEGSDLCNVERCALYIVEEDQKHVWSAARKVRLNVHAKDIRKACVLEVKLAAIDNQVSIRLLADCLRKLSWKESDIAEAVPGNRHSVTVDEALHLMDNLSTHDEERVALTDGGTKHWVVHNKKVLNIKDIASDERFTHSEVRQAAIAAGVDKKWTLLLGPVFEAVDEGEVGTKTGQEGEGERKVIGLVEMVNRRDENGKQIPFSEDDEKLVSMLCGHCSTFISQATDD